MSNVVKVDTAGGSDSKLHRIIGEIERVDRVASRIEVDPFFWIFDPSYAQETGPTCNRNQSSIRRPRRVFWAIVSKAKWDIPTSDMKFPEHPLSRF